MTPDDVGDLLQRRAERVRGLPAPLEEDGAIWAAEFSVGDRRCAILLNELRAAVPLRAVTPVPLAPAHVIGVLRFQGRLVAAFSLSALLGGTGWKDDPTVLIVVEPSPGRLVALDCEQIPKPVAIPSALVAAARSQGRRPIAPLGLRDIHLLDVGLLLEGRRAG